MHAPLIQDTEISVVVQGPIYGAEHDFLTRRVLLGVREILPKAEIILSTWLKSEVDGLTFDQLILSEDPGAPRQPHDSRVSYNVNRQIVSAKAGLQKASRPYALKLRTDMLLTDTGFLRYYDRFPARHPDYAVFTQRIITCTIYSMTAERSAELFMPSDFLSFGRTTDVRDLWDIPLAPEPETSRYFELHPEERWHGEEAANRFSPEQYIWVNCLLKHFPVPFRHAHDFSAEAIRISNLSLINNFIFLEMDKIGLSAPRHRVSKGAWAACFSHAEWLQLYHDLCDRRRRAPFDWSRLLKQAVHRLLLWRQKVTGQASGVRVPATSRI